VTEAEVHGWSFVFEQFIPAEDRAAVSGASVADAPWWRAVPWRPPEDRLPL
jgi:hypothetical protein